MAEPLMPSFQDPGSYVRYYGPSITNTQDVVLTTRYLRLLERSSPLRYPFKFPTTVGVDLKTASVTFGDLEPATGHVYQAFLGVPPGLRVQVFHPFDTRILQWDATVTAISTDQVGVVTHGLSPYEVPALELWIPPNKNYPALVCQNATADLLMFAGGLNGGVSMGKTILPRIIWLAASFRVQSIDVSQPSSADTAVNGVLLDMLEKKKIPSKPITFGGSFRAIPA
jgi:hypothetical protein